MNLYSYLICRKNLLLPTYRERNREHAKRSRIRKKFLLESLQQSVTLLKEENDNLRVSIRSHLGDDGHGRPRVAVLRAAIRPDRDDQHDPNQPTQHVDVLGVVAARRNHRPCAGTRNDLGDDRRRSGRLAQPTTVTDPRRTTA